MNIRKEVGPRYETVRQAVRIALYSPDPLKRAEAAASLTLWNLPVAPDAVVIHAERIAAKSAVA
jgi:hypothetical protein